MKASEDLSHLEEHWKEYLGRLERVWFKAFAHYKKSPKWHAWQAPYETLRKKDPLLSYLRNARGAEEHTLVDIVERQEGRIAIVPGEQGGTIRNLRISGGVATAEITGTVGVAFEPERIRLLPVMNRGVSYDVPKQHLGKPINPEAVISIAECGLAFYERFLQEAEVFFVSKK